MAIDYHIEELDVVALLSDFPALRLRRGQVGAVAHVHAPGVLEVEFVDRAGRTYALTTLHAREVIRLRYDPVSSVDPA